MMGSGVLSSALPILPSVDLLWWLVECRLAFSLSWFCTQMVGSGLVLLGLGHLIFDLLDLWCETG